MRRSTGVLVRSSSPQFVRCGEIVGSLDVRSKVVDLLSSILDGITSHSTAPINFGVSQIEFLKKVYLRNTRKCITNEKCTD